MPLLDVICAGDTFRLSNVSTGGSMGCMKKLSRRGFKFPRCLFDFPAAGRVRQKPQQLDLFGYEDFFYHEGRMYVSQKEDVSTCEQKEFQLGGNVCSSQEHS